MSDIIGYGYPTEGPAERQEEYNRIMKEVTEKATESYHKNGPLVHNWSLEMQVAIERIREELDFMLPHNPLLNESNFDAHMLDRAFQKMRSLESDISSKGGQYRKRFWKVENEAIVSSADPVFDHLVQEDRDLIGKSTPRELFTEIVASQEFLDSQKENGIDEETALSIKPLHSDEIIIVWYHGGGFYLECPGTNRSAALDISKETGYRLFLPDYRYMPVHPFPTPIYDGLTFFRYLVEAGFKPGNIIIAGDSAGGNLCLTIMQNLKKLNLSQPRAAILFSPWCDLSFTSDSWKRNVDFDFIPVPHFDRVTCDCRMYVAPGKKYDEKVREMLNHPLVSPLHGDYDGCAPMYIQSGEVELLVDDIDALAKKLGAKEVFIQGKDHPGIEPNQRVVYEKYAGMVHIFFLFDIPDEKYAAIKGVGNYVRSL
ncbi:Monoterpene epsilon-lactone hydrolase [Smittium culicis]|uniref:Monoterpene epsilon-lactone hydrolase n=1 Tax=Smittium culicis TaxID=133412 RepID=A0A1R1XN46_9FUNG|nr:Monoterpene epsilon-lactone hydrolase [Smittium culicis]OMJ24089.1 Monoterpene epsilon-lactone hydrolase [Smittium culicis]